ncbi:DUF1697 domain-containing protein [Bailinhaonella thermotolerans]|uniref:DUF1697 domain-containing protein n=1 Tax=Bailinhaonella thermotolerans TaxID=1070861 RepID=A0A3A4AMY1_9ACTN|nr:DUF1697 domain-containing protein [Bailinhaonella thermotolerans]RJL27173.1 DUF1697 domain-containing protein [Bailinhaonella thermotolerans]
MRCVALLRGVNAGSGPRVAMGELRAMLEGMGYGEVRTLLQSGNAVFTVPDGGAGDGDAVAAAVEDRLAAELGVRVRVMVRTAAELREVVEGNPLEVPDPAKFAVLFLAREPDPGILAIPPEEYAPEEMRPGRRELYVNFPEGMRRTRLPVLVEKRWNLPLTARNWNTVTRLLALAES